METSAKHGIEKHELATGWVQEIKGSTKAEYMALIAGMVTSWSVSSSEVMAILNEASQVTLQHNPDKHGSMEYVCSEDITYVYLDIFSHSDTMLTQLLLGSSESEYCINSNVVKVVDLLVKMENVIGVKHSSSFVVHNVIENGKGDLEGAIDILLQRKMNQDNPDPHGFYPLHYVSMRLKDDGKLLPVLNSLLDHDANVNVTNKVEITPLHYLANGGEKEVNEAVKVLLAHDADPNVKDAEDFLPIHYACGRELNGKFGNITGQKLNIIQQLVEKGSNVNDRGGEGLTPLHCCVLSGGEVQRSVEYLLLHHAKPNLPTRQKLCPIHIVCDTKRENKRTTTLDDLAQVTKHEQKQEISFRYLQNLLRGIAEEAAEDVSHKGPSVVDTSLLKLLINHGADVNLRGPQGRTPLHYVSLGMENQFDAMELLLNNGANVNAMDECMIGITGASPVHYICGLTKAYSMEPLPAWNRSLLELLVKHGANLNAQAGQLKVTPLHIASHADGPHASECIESLLNLKAKQDIGDDLGVYAIHYACGLKLNSGLLPVGLHDHITEPMNDNRINILKTMVQNNVDVNVFWQKKFAPLHMVLSGGTNDIETIFEAVSLLLEKGADPNQPDERGLRPIHLACYVIFKYKCLEEKQPEDASSLTGVSGIRRLKLCGKVPNINPDGNRNVDTGELLKILITHGADINVCEVSNQHTALHLAIKLGLPCGVIKILLEHKAKTDITDCHGFYPIQYTFDLYNDMDALLEPSYFDNRETDMSSTSSYSRIGARESRKLSITSLEEPRPEANISQMIHRQSMFSLERNVAQHIPRPLQSIPSLFPGASNSVLPQNQGLLIPNNLLTMTPERKQHMSDVIELLLAHKTDVNVTQEKRSTKLETLQMELDLKKRRVLHLAVLQLSHDPDIIIKILDAGADPNLPDAYGMCPLHYACKIPTCLEDVSPKNICKIVQALIEHGADVNKDDDSFNTPIHYAMECGIPKTIQMLLDAGAKINKRNIKGLKPEDLAVGSVEKDILAEHAVNIKKFDSFNETSVSDPESAQLRKAFLFVSCRIGFDWKLLLRILAGDFGEEADGFIDELEEKYRGGINEQAFQGFKWWKKRQGRSANLDAFIMALSDANLTDLSEKVEEKYLTPKKT